MIVIRELGDKLLDWVWMSYCLKLDDWDAWLITENPPPYRFCPVLLDIPVFAALV